jgi:tRNA G46 methylase TrmB
MAKAFPQSRFVGIDISSEAIDEARRQARRQKIENLDFWCWMPQILKIKGNEGII